MALYTDLNIELTDEQIAIKEETHKFAREVLRPASLELDKISDPDEMKNSKLYWDTMKQLYDLGYHTILISDNYGGLGIDPLAIHITLEELAWGSVGFAVGIVSASTPFTLAAINPNDYLIDNFIVPFCECKDASIVGCWSITEPDHGSDSLCPYTDTYSNPDIFWQVTAKEDDDEWIINGQKSAWVNTAPGATHSAVFLGVEQSMGMSGGGIAIVPTDLPGVRKGKALNKLGQREMTQGEIFYDNVRIPKEYMLCGHEASVMMTEITLSLANACMGSFFTGLSRAAYEEALAYTKQRIQGGKPLFEHQLVKHKLFDMFMKIEASRALSRAALVYNFNNFPPQVEYSIASKVFCTKTALEVTSDAIQLMGGNGLSREYPVEKFFRDARAGLIEDGANDTLMLTGAHHL